MAVAAVLLTSQYATGAMAVPDPKGQIGLGEVFRASVTLSGSSVNDLPAR